MGGDQAPMGISTYLSRTAMQPGPNGAGGQHGQQQVRCFNMNDKLLHALYNRNPSPKIPSAKNGKSLSIKT